jgi:hypothetical protein
VAIVIEPSKSALAQRDSDMRAVVAASYYEHVMFSHDRPPLCLGPRLHPAGCPPRSRQVPGEKGQQAIPVLFGCLAVIAVALRESETVLGSGIQLDGGVDG